MKFVATIEARMSSSRLPGKVLLPANMRPMLYHLVRRLEAVPSIDEIALATTTNAADEPLVEFATTMGVRVFRGSEEDVMARVIGAAESADADVVIEITGDCPIIDPDLVEQTIRMFKRHSVAYASNSCISSYPDGMETQVFALRTLKESARMTDDLLDREHVSRHIVNHPELFTRVILIAPPSLHWPGLGLTLDEPADYELLKNIIEHFGDAKPLFSCLEVITLLRERPDWLQINSAVRRRDTRPT